MLGVVQADCSVCVQPPVVGLQQAPNCGHGFGEQVVHPPFHTFGVRQADCSVCVQPPVGVQQAPVAQGFGVHVVLLPCHVPPLKLQKSA